MEQAKELIKVIYQADNKEPMVDARALHEALESKKDFSSWIKQKIEDLQLEDGKDYESYSPNLVNKGIQKKEYNLTLDSAKHIAMITKGQKAHEIRNYFIKVEKAWQNPELVAARSLQLNDKNYPATTELTPIMELLKAVVNEQKRISQIVESKETYENLLVNQIKMNIDYIEKNYHINKRTLYPVMYHKFRDKNPKTNLSAFREIYGESALINNIKDKNILEQLLAITQEMTQEANKEWIEKTKIDLSKIWED